MSEKIRQSAVLQACLVLALWVGAAGCKHEEPNVIYMPDMVYGPAVMPQEAGSTRLPPEGTVPRGIQRYRSSKDPKDWKNPLRPTSAVLKRGRYVFETFCLVCHGSRGEGDGPIIGKFPKPPSLLSQKVRDWTDGDIFNVITNGQGIMPPYRYQVIDEDRWAAILYIRVLQKARYPTAEDLKAASSS